jgi:hypothetical protein
MNSTYKIYTERFANDKAQLIVARYFDAFTMYPTTGYWKGQVEDSVVFEILTDDSDRVLHAAEALRVELNQEAVLVTRVSSGEQLVTADTFAHGREVN